MIVDSLTDWLTNKQLVRRMVYWIKLMNGINDFIDRWNISIVSLFETVAIIAKWMSEQCCSTNDGFCDGMCLQLLPLNEDSNWKGNEQKHYCKCPKYSAHINTLRKSNRNENKNILTHTVLLFLLEVICSPRTTLQRSLKILNKEDFKYSHLLYKLESEINNESCFRYS